MQPWIWSSLSPPAATASATPAPKYVIAHHVWVFDVGDGMTLYIGPDRKGVDLEVGTVRGREGGIYVIHAMKLRAQFVEEYRSRLPWKR